MDNGLSGHMELLAARLVMSVWFPGAASVTIPHLLTMAKLALGRQAEQQSAWSDLAVSNCYKNIVLNKKE